MNNDLHHEVTGVDKVSSSTEKADHLVGFLCWWRWADSNRRPNIVPKSFLHAYSFFGCRERTAERQAIQSLFSKSYRTLEKSMRATLLDDTLNVRYRVWKTRPEYSSRLPLATRLRS